MIGNFKRQGTVSCKGKPKAYDHDFKSFSDGIIVPYGIYDVGANTGYLTLGLAMTPLSLSVTISFIFGNNSYNGNTQMPTQSAFSVMVAVLMHVSTI